MQRKEFREDLFYRLNVVRVGLPPLRERTSDIPLLVGYFMNKFRLKQPTGPSQIADDAMAAIQRCTWPGNVRELENCIQRAMVLASGNTITLANLPEEIARGYRPALDPAKPAFPSATGPAPAGEPAAPSPAAAPAPRPARPRMTQAVETLFNFARNDKQFKLLPAAERELIVRALAENLRQPGPGRQAPRRHARHPAQARRQIRHPEADGDRTETALVTLAGAPAAVDPSSRLPSVRRPPTKTHGRDIAGEGAEA